MSNNNEEFINSIKSTLKPNGLAVLEAYLEEYIDANTAKENIERENNSVYITMDILEPPILNNGVDISINERNKMLEVINNFG